MITTTPPAVIEGVINVVGDVGLPGNFSFKVTGQWKPITPFATPSKDQVNDPNHTANDMQLIPIEKVYSNRDSIRKAREAFLISKGRTLLPHGLNIREEIY